MMKGRPKLEIDEGKRTECDSMNEYTSLSNPVERTRDSHPLMAGRQWTETGHCP